jgi:hypothetical protein
MRPRQLVPRMDAANNRLQLTRSLRLRLRALAAERRVGQQGQDSALPDCSLQATMGLDVRGPKD